VVYRQRDRSRAFLRDMQPRDSTSVVTLRKAISRMQMSHFAGIKSKMRRGSREGAKIGLPLHVAERLVEAPLRVVGAAATDSSAAAAHRRRRRPAQPRSGATEVRPKAQGIGRA
jgi:hypothetical protein